MYNTFSNDFLSCTQCCAVLRSKCAVSFFSFCRDSEYIKTHFYNQQKSPHDMSDEFELVKKLDLVRGRSTVLRCRCAVSVR